VLKSSNKSIPCDPDVNHDMETFDLNENLFSDFSALLDQDAASEVTCSLKSLYADPSVGLEICDLMFSPGKTDAAIRGFADDAFIPLSPPNPRSLFTFTEDVTKNTFPISSRGSMGSNTELSSSVVSSAKRSRRSVD
jgi:hypothetical protein